VPSSLGGLGQKLPAWLRPMRQVVQRNDDASSRDEPTMFEHPWH
jgi:hypothetical protein